VSQDIEFNIGSERTPGFIAHMQESESIEAYVWDSEVDDNKVDLVDYLSELDSREIAIIRGRLGCTATRTLEDIARDFGVVRERIRQLEAKVMSKIDEIPKNIINAYAADKPLLRPLAQLEIEADSLVQNLHEGVTALDVLYACKVAHLIEAASGSGTWVFLADSEVSESKWSLHAFGELLKAAERSLISVNEFVVA
jgi:hypothetical protein